MSETFPTFVNGQPDRSTLTGSELITCVVGAVTDTCTPAELATYTNGRDNLYLPTALTTAGITAAANAAHAAGGGTVKLPPQQITLTGPLPMYDGVVYEGTGFGQNQGTPAFTPTGTWLIGDGGTGGGVGTFDCFAYHATSQSGSPPANGSTANNQAFQAGMLKGGGIRGLSVMGFNYGIHIGDYYNPGWCGGFMEDVMAYNCNWGFFVENFDACKFKRLWAMQCGSASNSFSGSGFFGQSSNGNFNNGDSIFEHLASFKKAATNWGWLFQARGAGGDALNNNEINYITESTNTNAIVQPVNTTSGNASIQVTDTTKFAVGQPVAFFGLGRAGIINGLCYFVSAIIDSTHLKVTSSVIDPVQSQYWTDALPSFTVNGSSGFPVSVTNGNPLATITNTSWDQDWPGWAGTPGRPYKPTIINLAGFSGGAAGNNDLYYVLQQQGATTFWLTRAAPWTPVQLTPVSSGQAYSAWATGNGFAQPCIVSWGMPGIAFVGTGPINNIQPHTVYNAGVEGTHTCAFLFQRANSINMDVTDQASEGTQGVGQLATAVYRTASNIIVRATAWATDIDNGSNFNQAFARAPSNYLGSRIAPQLTFGNTPCSGLVGILSDPSGRLQTTAPGSTALFLSPNSFGPDVAFNANGFLELGGSYPVGIPTMLSGDGDVYQLNPSRTSHVIYSGAGGAGLTLNTIGPFGDGLLLLLVNPTATPWTITAAGGQKIVNGNGAGSLATTSMNILPGRAALITAFYNGTYNGQGTAANYSWVKYDGGGPTIVNASATADSSANGVSNTALANDSDLIVSVVPGTYNLTAFLAFYEATLGTGGFQFDFGQGTATVASILFSADGYGTAVLAAAAATSATTAQQVAAVTTSSSGPSWALANGEVTFSTAGTFGVRWAQVSSSANATFRKRKSFLELRQIA